MSNVMISFMFRCMFRCFFFMLVTLSDSPNSFVSFSIFLRTPIAGLARCTLRDIMTTDSTMVGPTRARTKLR